MKKVLGFGLALLTAGSLHAYDGSTNSLIGVELGGASFDLENNAGLGDDSQSGALVGVKIGAQSESYRLFVGARYLDISDADLALAYGASLQYLLRVNPQWSIYAGVNAGEVSIEFEDDYDLDREISEFYIGGDVGVNVAISPSLDFEAGVSLMNLNAENSRLVDAATNTYVTYSIDHIVNYHVSLIYKFSID